MLNDPRSHGLWERTAPPAPLTARLSDHVVADVAVVGAGFTGLSAALHLAEAGASVVVVEGAEIGFGGSGRNVGLVNAGLWVMPAELPGILGPLHGERLLDLLGNAPALVFKLVETHGIDCEARRNGTLHCGVGAKGADELAERARQWQARSAPVQLLDAEETCRRVGNSVYTAALLDQRAGTIQPLAYARGLARAALSAGARIYTGSAVVSSRRTGGAWHIATPHGAVTAEWVIVATNAYTVGAWPAIRQEVVHLPYFNIATRPLNDNLRRTILPERQGVWDTKDVLSSYRFDNAGRLVIGSVGALRGAGTAIHRSWARRTLALLFPQLGPVEFEAEWYGMIGMTADLVPKFHRLDERVLSFSGYNGRGIAPGTVFGRALAEHVTGRLAEADMPLPVTAPAAQRFRRLRETYYEFGSQIAHISARV
ncbi:FAD-binding oxidoreductase [Acidisoma sp. S159]|uniref:NAD(P)/FAD-dependent oxidoreductase n=1 Tax=Acidisoma sp. S159 TaxID=1747225 RepID=UPI00131D4167|nr:FAD-binding oxidoreductase [Acidisoma sp. S159]